MSGLSNIIFVFFKVYGALQKNVTL